MQYPHPSLGALSRRHTITALLGLIADAALAGCDDSTGNEAQDAYAGFATAIDRMLTLGFLGLNASTSGGIPEQLGDGINSGTLVVTGTASQGNATDRSMRLTVAVTDYSDGAAGPDALFITYTGADVVIADLSMTGLPNAALTGTFKASLGMKGELTGSLTIDLTVEGETEGDGAGGVRMKAGTLHLQGNASSKYGGYQVDEIR